MTTTASMANVTKVEVVPTLKEGAVCQIQFWCKNGNLQVVALSAKCLDDLEAEIAAFHIPSVDPLV